MKIVGTQLALHWVAMKTNPARILSLALAMVLMLTTFQGIAHAGFKSSYLYSLSNFNGKFPFNDVRIRTDRTRDEVYVIDGGIVRIFNNAGMEEYWFGDNAEFGSIYDLAIDEKGDIFLLSYEVSESGDRRSSIVQCNYRGEVKEKFRIYGPPPASSPFNPDTIMYRDGNYYLVGSSKGRVNVTNRKGEFLREYDLLSIIDIPANERGDKEVSGFSVDGAGNMLFTVPVLFRAYVVSPDGKLAASFGRAGSAPGMFGIVGGITADEFGNYLVVERLRSVVMVFDKKFRFQHEFGYRGAGKPWNLVRPSELAVGKAGRVYVNQLRGRGVSVFSLIYD